MIRKVLNVIGGIIVLGFSLLCFWLVGQGGNIDALPRSGFKASGP